FQYLSPAAQRVLEIEAEAAIGSRWRDSWAAAPERLEEAVKRALDGENSSFEGAYAVGEGPRRRLDMSFSGIRDEEKIVRRVGAVVRDVTELKQLEGKNAQAKKLESIGQLAAGIAHEINTPIQYIGDNARFLEDAFSQIQPMIRLDQ